MADRPGDDLLTSWLAAAGPEQTAIARADRGGPVRASYSQRGIWLAQQIAGDEATSYVVRHQSEPCM
jgi:hypothetical protein